MKEADPADYIQKARVKTGVAFDQTQYFQLHAGRSILLDTVKHLRQSRPDDTIKDRSRRWWAREFVKEAIKFLEFWIEEVKNEPSE